MTPPADDDPWLTVPQVSEELKLHPATVRVWINSGRLAAARAGRTWRVRRSDVERALLADASPAFRNPGQSASSTPAEEAANGSARPSAPRRLADHILSVEPRAPRES